MRGAKAAVIAFFRRALDLNDVSPTSPFIHSHLTKVYATLLLSSVCAICGLLLDYGAEIGGYFTSIASASFFFHIFMTNPWRERKRMWYLVGATFFMGASFEPWLRPLLNCGHRFLIAIMVGKASFYLIFAVVAMWTRETCDRAELYCNATVASYEMLALVWIVQAHAIFKNPYTVAAGVLYLIWFPATVVAYSQKMALRGRWGDEMDGVGCCIRFYTHFFALISYCFALMLKDAYEDGLW